METFLVPAGEGSGEYSEKRSRFIGQVWPVETETEALAHIEAVKKQHYDAKHNCWCYILRSGTVRYSDDGEPQGTAGQPMLGVFQKNEITNVCCTVTRYFGGVLLGTGGLVRAYTEAAKSALETAGISRMASWQTILLPCSYSQFERMKRLLEDHEAVTESIDYGAEIQIFALVREDRADSFHSALQELTAGSLQAEITGTRFCGVRVV